MAKRKIGQTECDSSSTVSKASPPDKPKMAKTSGPTNVTSGFVRCLALETDHDRLTRISSVVEGACEANPEKKLRVGSICSGSGGGDVGLNVVLSTVGNLVAGSALGKPLASPVFCCEVDQDKQKFLASNIKPEVIFENAAFMGDAKALDKDNNLVEVPDCDFLSAGFSCKDLSLLNNTRSEKMHQVWQMLDNCFSLTESELSTMAEDKDLIFITGVISLGRG